MKGRIRIFILDDDRYYGTLIKNALNRNDFDVQYFQGEKECIEALSNRPHVLILDHKLEKCTGLDVLRELKDRYGDSTKVIYFSAQEHVHVTLKALSEGAVNYIEKSHCSLKELDHAIESMIDMTDHFTKPLDVEAYRRNWF